MNLLPSPGPPELVEKPGIPGKLAVNVKEAAQLLGLAEKTIYTLTHRADFPAIRVGVRVIIPVDGLREWLENHMGEVMEI